MRRKLIKQDALERINNESVTLAEKELNEAAPILAKSLGFDHLKLSSFNSNTALFETINNTYIHAGYDIKNGALVLNNIEELVVEEESRKAKIHGILSNLIDCVLLNKNDKAKEHFSEYMSNVRWNEAKNPFAKFNKEKGKKGKDKEDKKGKKVKDKEEKNNFFVKAKKASKELAEAYATSVNVLEYVDHMKFGPAVAESVIKTDERGNVTDIKIPVTKVRNESKLQRAEWKSLNSKVAESRKVVASLAESQEFCKAAALLKRQNSLSDLDSFEESLNHVVKSWPEVIYATEVELSGIISEALTTANVASFGDKDCEFLAESILKKAQVAYPEKISQVLHLASAPALKEGNDSYRHFQDVVESFYPTLDEKFGLERKVFTDLYESLGVVFKKADRQGDQIVKKEAASFLNDLADVLNGETKPEILLAEEAAEFLANIIETNLESGKWVVSNSPHMTVNGDHPDMAKKAAHGYTPSKDFSGDWGDEAPAIGQDDNNYKSGKNAKTMRNNSWGQVGGADIFPKIKNPYLPKPFGDYTMKGEKGVDKENSGLGMWSSEDTWPSVTNPYSPKEDKNYKMKNGSETDLVTSR